MGKKRMSIRDWEIMENTIAIEESKNFYIDSMIKDGLQTMELQKEADEERARIEFENNRISFRKKRY